LEKQFSDWKLASALALIVALCGRATPHVEPKLSDFTPTTVSPIQVSGASVSTSTSEFLLYGWPVGLR
jgi:hypothetical protein